MNEHTNPTKRLTKVLRKGRAKAFGSGEAFYAAFEQAIAKTKEDIDALYVRKEAYEQLKMRLDEADDRAYNLELDADVYCSEIAVLKNELADMERTHMKLPVDADGVPIRPGDRVEALTGIPTTFIVREMLLFESSWLVHGCRGNEFRHVQPDTLESILEEFHMRTWVEGDDGSSVIAEYAERIRNCER